MELPEKLLMFQLWPARQKEKKGEEEPKTNNNMQYIIQAVIYRQQCLFLLRFLKEKEKKLCYRLCAHPFIMPWDIIFF